MTLRAFGNPLILPYLGFRGPWCGSVPCRCSDQVPGYGSWGLGYWRHGCGDRGRISFSNVHLRKPRLLCVTKGGMEGQTHLLSPGLADVYTELVLSVRAWVV